MAIPAYGFTPHEQAIYRARLKKHNIHTRDTTAIIGYLLTCLEEQEARLLRLERLAGEAEPEVRIVEVVKNEPPKPVLLEVPENLKPFVTDPSVPWHRLTFEQRQARLAQQGKPPMQTPNQKKRQAEEAAALAAAESLRG